MHDCSIHITSSCSARACLAQRTAIKVRVLLCMTRLLRLLRIADAAIVTFFFSRHVFPLYTRIKSSHKRVTKSQNTLRTTNQSGGGEITTHARPRSRHNLVHSSRSIPAQQCSRNCHQLVCVGGRFKPPEPNKICFCSSFSSIQGSVRTVGSSFGQLKRGSLLPARSQD